MPILAEVTKVLARDKRDLLHQLRQLEAALPGCKWFAVSETLGALGRVRAGQGTTSRPLKNLAEVEQEFRYIARKPFHEFEDCDRILFAVAVVDKKKVVRAVLTLERYSFYYITQSKRVENDRPQRESWQLPIRPGDRGGMPGKMPRVKRVNRHLSHEAPIPEGQGLRTTRRT